MRVPRSAVKVTAFAALVAGAFVSGALRARAVAHADRSIVAFVNGAAIAADDVELRLAEILPVASYHGHVEPGRLLALRRAALDELVLDELIYNEAVRHGRTAAGGTIDADVAAAKARFAESAQFVQALAESGLSEDEFRDVLAKAILVREARESRAQPLVTDADIEAYYRANAATFQRPEQVRLLEILVRADPGDPASGRKAERAARQLFARIVAGESFGAIARAHSDDEYRVKEGDMGLVHRGRLDEAFDTAVFQAPVGRLSIARSLYGYQVFKVLARRPATQLTLSEARPIITERLTRQRREQAERAWREALLAGARVEIVDPTLRAARPADLGAPLTLASRLRSGSRQEGQ